MTAFVTNVVYAAILLGAFVLFCWFVFVVARVAFTAESYAPPADEDGGPDYAAVDYWAGTYPGGRNDRNPPRPPDDHPGRIGN